MGDPRPQVPPQNDPRAATTNWNSIFWTGTAGCTCLGLLAISAAVLIFGFGVLGMVSTESRPATEAVETMLAQIRQGKIDQAYADLSESCRSRMTQAEFEQLVASHPVLEANADVSFTSRSVSKDAAALGGTLTSASGAREKVIIELVKVGDTWRIASIILGPTPGDWSRVFPPSRIPD